MSAAGRRRAATDLITVALVEALIALLVALPLWLALAQERSALLEAAGAPAGAELVSRWQWALALAACAMGGAAALVATASAVALRGHASRPDAAPARRPAGVRACVHDLALALPTAALAVLLYADGRLFAAQALHLDADFVRSGLAAGNAMGESHLGASTYLSVALAVVALAVATAALRALLRRGGAALRQRLGAAAAAWVAALWIVALIPAVAAVRDAEAALRRADPAADALLFAERLLGARVDVGLLTFAPPALDAAVAEARASAAAAARKPDVLLLLVESWRYDALQPRWMPELSALAAELPCLRSARHYAGSHATVWSVFSALFGLDALLFEPVAEAGAPSTPMAMLAALGYQRLGWSASPLRGWDHGDHVVAGLDGYTELADGDVPSRDRAVIAALHGALADADADVDTDAVRPVFAFGFLYAPHHNYHFPPEHARHLPVLPIDYNHFAPDDQLARHAEAINNRYRNAVGFVDAEIAGLLRALRPRVEAGELVVIVSGDHGEEFWDHGAVGHGAARFWDARTAVPLLFCGRDLAGRSVAISSHVDLMPTVLDLLGVDALLPTERWSTGHSLLREAAGPVVVSGVGYPWRGKGLAQVSVEAGARVKRWYERGADALAPAQTRRMDAADVAIADDEATAAADAAAARALRRRLGRFLRRLDAVEGERAAGAGDAGGGFEALRADFAGLVALDGVRVSPGSAQAGGHARVELRLQRRAGSAEVEDLRVFSHLVRARGDHALVRNFDHVPVEGQLPIARWRDGAWVRDVVHVAFPGGLRAGDELLLLFGIYRPGRGRVTPVVPASVAASDGVGGVVHDGVVVARWRVE